MTAPTRLTSVSSSPSRPFPPPPDGPTAVGTGAPFASTQWSVVLEARAGSHDRHSALEILCRTYWLPIYGYLRRRGHAPADAEDLTQGFFVFLLESDFLDRPDRSRGRFRGYLVGALRHFVSEHFERASAQKRGGRTAFVNWDSLDAEHDFAALDPDGTNADPAQLFERGWALTLFAGALAKLEDEQRAAGRARAFQILKPFLSATPTRGDYDRAAATLATSRPTIAVWVHRLNHRYAELVKLAVAATVQHPTDVREELQHLIQTLRA